MTRLKRLEGRTTTARVTSTFSPYSQTVPASAPPNNASSTVFVISCIDPRFTSAVEEYLFQQLGPSTNYDLFVIAGASMGGRLTGNGAPIPSCSLVSPNNSWRETLFDHLQVAITLHNVSLVYIIDHLDCAAYGVCGATDTIAGHKANFDVLKGAIVAATFYANGTSNPTPKTTVFSGVNITGLYFNTPVGSTTQLFDYTASAPGTSVGTFTFPSSSGAKILVLGCIDPRFSEILSAFLVNYKEVQFVYDLFITAGSSLGVNQSYNLDGTQRPDNNTGTAYTNNILAAAGGGKIGGLGHKWGPTFFDHLDVAVKVHGITEVWVFDHLDCGAYKAIKFGNLALSDNDPNQHIPEIIKLKGYINLAQPSLGFKGFIMDNSGVVSKVVDDSKGVLLDTVVYPATLGTVGSSRIRAPASEILELRAKAAADYVLVQEHSGTTKGGFGRELIRTKLTPLNTKGSSFNNGSSRGYTLETKVGKLKSGFLNRNRL